MVMVYREGYRFLQGHLTCDLMQRTKDNPLLGATRDIKGLVVASMFLIADEGNLDVNNSQGESVATAL